MQKNWPHSLRSLGSYLHHCGSRSFAHWQIEVSCTFPVFNKEDRRGRKIKEKMYLFRLENADLVFLDSMNLRVHDLHQSLNLKVLIATSLSPYDFYSRWKKRLFCHAQSIAFTQVNKVGIHKYLKLNSSSLLTKIRICSHY